MFILYANKNMLTLRKREPMTSGSVNAYEVRFEFSPDWDGLTRTVVFKAGSESRSILLDESGECVIPWEVLTVPNVALRAGVYGTKGGELVLPTVWENLGIIQEGVTVGESARPPTPDLWEQALASKADGLSLDGLTLNLLSGAETLDHVELPQPGGGEGGTSDHRHLTGRDAQDQHPVSAITGLQDILETIPVPMTAEQLRKILMNGGKQNA